MSVEKDQPNPDKVFPMSNADYGDLPRLSNSDKNRFRHLGYSGLQIWRLNRTYPTSRFIRRLRNRFKG